SSDIILGVKGSAHPFSLYQKAGVPITLATDDEGVSRHDLTTEYMRAVKAYRLSYEEIKQISYNGLKYAFVDAQTKARLLKELDEKFASFEARYAH
ncbi:MAG TPA: adenosine deaminase, partial [Hellea balneolensis]|nr:adenosine deaminase [Hellea balneolensis]